MKIVIKSFFILLLTLNVSVVFAAQDYTVKQSRYSVGETIDRLEKLIKQKGIIVYSRIYHMMGAKIEGAHLRPAQMIMFGNPNAGSPILNENPLAALDLPFKVLAWQDENNQTWLAYLNTAEFKKRHKIQNTALLTQMDTLVNTLTNNALGYK